LARGSVDLSGQTLSAYHLASTSKSSLIARLMR
jgi:hypothetical protein